jgi:ComF family protein
LSWSKLRVRVHAGIEEAVFSSSGDRFAAIQAKAAVSGHSIASDTVSKNVRPWALRSAVQIAEGLFAVLFPSDCRICGNALIKVGRLPVCHECLDSIRPITGGLCAVCGERLFSPYVVASEDSLAPRCGLCQRIEPTFARAVAYGSYEDGLRELIHLLKYSTVRPAANVLGRMLAEAMAEIEPEVSGDSVAVVPVPLYRSKRRQREYNHAELIARAAVKIIGGRLHLNPELLKRTRETVSQTGLTRHQRRENVRGAFAVTQVETVRGREVVVVDDVFTTGATVSECARVLRRAGATKVWVATVARTLKIVEHHVEIRLPDEEVKREQEISLGRAAGI